MQSERWCQILPVLIFGMGLAGLANPIWAESPLAPAVSEATAATPAASPEPAADTQASAANPEIQSLIETSPTAADLPDDAVIILLKEENHFVNEDGTATIHVHEFAKILRESGKSLGQIALTYNQSKEELDIEIARTIKPDGAMLGVDPKLIQDLAVLGDTPLFSDLRVRQMVYPNVNVGDFLELQYKLRIKEPIVAGVYTAYFTYPLGVITQKSRLTISIPAQIEPHYAVTLPSGPEPQIIERGGRRIYHWEPGSIILSRAHEPAIPPSFDVDPYVFFSTMKSWDVLAQWYVPLFETNLEKTSDQIREMVTFTVSEKGPDQTEIIKALFDFVSKKIDYVGISLGESAWEAYPPSYVMKNGYGDCKGKAALLITMLRQAGIQAYGVLIKPSDEGRLLKEIPSLDFSHMIVAIPRPGGYLYMDPTLPLVPHDFLLTYEENRDVIILDQTVPHFEKTPVFTPEQSDWTHTFEKIFIAEDGSLKVQGRVTMQGLSALEYRNLIRTTNPGIMHDMLEGLLREEYPQSHLEHYAFHHAEEVDQPFELTLDTTVQGAVQKAGNLLLADPYSVLDPKLASLVTFDQRYYPVFLGVKQAREWEGLMEPPQGYAVKALPSNVSMQEAFGSYERHFEASGRGLKGFKRFVLSEPVISVDMYGRFKNFIERIAQLEKEKILFEQTSPPAAEAPPPAV